MSALPNLEPVLAALPASCSRRLAIIGLNQHSLRDPERLLRRAIGAPQDVNLVDLELDPERWHGTYVSTTGSVGWSRETTCLGRIWLDPSWALYAAGKPAVGQAELFQAELQGILIADPRVRAAHRQRHAAPGGYGHFGLFVAELFVTSITVAPHLSPEAAAPPRPLP